MQTSSQNVPLRALKLRAEQNHPFIDHQEYHGDAPVSVPFNWESQPGTPKARFRERKSNLPPLTPPPSYFYKTCASRKPNRILSKGRILNTIFPKPSSHPDSPASSFTSSSSSSSSSFSWARTPSPWRMAYSPRLWKFRGSSTSEAPISRKLEFEEDTEVESPSPSLCFGFGREVNARSRGRCASSSMIKVLLRDV